MDTAKVIIESAGVVVATHDMTVCYDERGESSTDTVAQRA